jgi:hypothetical protein
MVAVSLSKRAGKVAGDIMADMGRKFPGSGKFSLRLFAAVRCNVGGKLRRRDSPSPPADEGASEDGVAADAAAAAADSAAGSAVSPHQTDALVIGPLHSAIATLRAGPALDAVVRRARERRAAKEAISCLHLRALDADGSGAIDEDEVRSVLVSLAMQGEQTGAQAQGDAEMYSAKRLIERCLLRQHPDVLVMLELWWRLALRDIDADGDGFLGAAEYGELYVRLLRAFDADADASNDLSHSEAAAAAERDWATDSGGDGQVDREEFYDAVFQLADTWTTGTEAEEYVGFLRQLKDIVFPEKWLVVRRIRSLASDAYFLDYCPLAHSLAPPLLVSNHSSTCLQTNQERLPNKKAQKFPLRRSSVQMAGRGELEVMRRLDGEYFLVFYFLTHSSPLLLLACFKPLLLLVCR